MNSTPDFSVIVCAYTDRRWDALVEAVESVLRQSVRARELIVVIDHNPALLERARERFQHLDPARVRVMENSLPRGLSGARNAGIAAATGEFVAFLDDDATADSRWLERLGSAFRDERVMGVGSTIELQWLGPEPRWFPSEFNWTVGGTYRGMPTERAPIRNLIGAAMALRRDLFEGREGFLGAMGRTDAIKLPLGAEETELCIRLRQAYPERAFVFEPSAHVRHKVTLDRASWRYFASRCYAEGLSKAHLTRLVGREDGLQSERAYTLRVLPSGVVRGLRDAVRGDASGLGRAAAIVLGLFATALGYLLGSLPKGGGAQPAPAPARS